MRAYAKKFSEDEEQWGVVGLVHDVDYEQFPDKHPFTAATWLKEKSYPQDMIDAVLGHATYSGVERTSKMAQCLFAVDELCGFIMACAHVRPEKLVGMKPSSVKKKLKDKRFAAAINRNEIAQAIEEFNIDPDEHIQFVIASLQPIASHLGF